eukprot:6183303-Amphidinium_carterae.2
MMSTLQPVWRVVCHRYCEKRKIAAGHDCRGDPFIADLANMIAVRAEKQSAGAKWHIAMCHIVSEREKPCLLSASSVVMTGMLATLRFVCRSNVPMLPPLAHHMQQVRQARCAVRLPPRKPLLLERRQRRVLSLHSVLLRTDRERLWDWGAGNVC